MKFVKLVLIFVLIITNFAHAKLHADDSIYQLVCIEENADFAYKLLENIDGLQPPYPASSSFMIGDIPTTGGRHRIFKFIAPFISQSHEQPQKSRIFHNLLAISTDKDNNIVDAWHYPLEWQDSPALKLYRLGKKGLKLTRYLEVQKLELANATGETFRNQGILDDCYNSRLHFPEAAANEVVELSLNPDELREDKDKVVFEPGSGMKQTSYTSYFFAKKEFETKVGKLPLQKKLSIKAEILKTELKNYNPDNPMVQKPYGGFDLTHHQCGIISVIKSPKLKD